jgi:hypothetical protein
MRIRGVESLVLMHGIVLYGRRRIVGRRRFLAAMIAPAAGRQELSDSDRRDALGVDAMFRRLGVGCLWRAAVVTSMLRGRGIGARVSLSVGGSGATLGHAEAEVGGVSLRPHPGGAILR